MPNAARLTDPTEHGGTIVTGSSNVTINGLGAARKGDQHTCPEATGMAAHVGGAISKASATVTINGLPAARKGDGLLCMSPGGGPEGSGEGSKDEHGGWKSNGGREDKFGVRELKSFGDSKKESMEDARDHVVKVDVVDKEWAKGERAYGKFGGKHGKVLQGDYHANSKVSAEINSLKDMKASLTPIDVGASGSAVQLGTGKGEGALGSGEASMNLLSVEAKAKVGVDFDTKKNEYFAGAQGAIGGSVVQGKVAGESKPLKIPGTSWGISFEGEAIGSLLTAEAEAHAGAQYDEHGFKMSFGAKLGALVAGLGFHVGISIKPLKESAGKTQDVIRGGSRNVVIGG